MSTAADSDDLRVSPLELFFDLVFVFSITQVAALLAGDPSLESLIGGLLVLFLIWWSWSQYTWVLNSLGNEATVMKLTLLAAMAAVLFMGLAVPDALGEGGMWFAAGYAAVLLLGLTVFAVGAPPDQRADRNRYAIPAFTGVLTVLVGGLVEGERRLVVWGVAWRFEIGAAFFAGSGDFRIKPAHFDGAPRAVRDHRPRRNHRRSRTRRLGQRT